MNEETFRKIVKLIKDLMKVDITSLKLDTKINTIPTWDSFNNLMLISRFQEEFGIEFKAVDIENIQTIGDLISFLKKSYIEA